MTNYSWVRREYSGFPGGGNGSESNDCSLKDNSDDVYHTNDVGCSHIDQFDIKVKKLE